MKPFSNEPVLELRRASVRDELVGALRELEKELALRVGDQSKTFESTDPGKPDRGRAQHDCAKSTRR